MREGLARERAVQHGALLSADILSTTHAQETGARVWCVDSGADTPCPVPASDLVPLPLDPGVRERNGLSVRLCNWGGHLHTYDPITTKACQGKGGQKPPEVVSELGVPKFALPFPRCKFSLPRSDLPAPKDAYPRPMRVLLLGRREMPPSLKPARLPRVPLGVSGHLLSGLSLLQATGRSAH